MSSTETVAALFQALEESGVRYAVLRNYEHLPKIYDETRRRTTDIDLVMHSDDLPLWRDIATKVAQRFGWDVMIECDHWNQSPVRHHNIDVFRFYRYAPTEFVQVDIFHAFIALGLPVLDEREMLEDRIYDPGLRLTRVDPLKEVLQRLIQICSLLPSGNYSAKIARYSLKVKAAIDSNHDELLATVKRYFGPWGSAAVRAFQTGENARFVSLFRRAKLFFAIRFLITHPVVALQCISCRIGEQRLRFRTRQCGFVAGISVTHEEQRALVRTILDELAEWNFIDEWKERATPGSAATWNERCIMEQGGIVIEWVARDNARIRIGPSDTRSSIRHELIEMLATRHAPLHDNAVTRPAPASLCQSEPSLVGVLSISGSSDPRILQAPSNRDSRRDP